MDAVAEYLIPLEGFFKKKRSPKQVAALEAMEDYAEIVKDFNEAKSLNEDKIRIGKMFLYCKDRVTIIRAENIHVAEYVVAGADGDTEARINLMLINGKLMRLCAIYNEDPKKVAGEIFEALNAIGIKTVWG